MSHQILDNISCCCKKTQVINFPKLLALSSLCLRYEREALGSMQRFITRAARDPLGKNNCGDFSFDAGKGCCRTLKMLLIKTIELSLPSKLFVALKKWH
jgi:hypothetical protein